MQPHKSSLLLRFVFISVWGLWLTSSLASPVPFDPQYPPEWLAKPKKSPDVLKYLDAVEEAFERVESQIKKMKTTVQCAMDTKANQHARCLEQVHAVFTDKCKIEDISKTLNLIAAPSAHLPIVDLLAKFGPNDQNAVALIRHTGSKPGLYIAPDYYKGPLWGQVMILVNQASQYFAKTADYWEYNADKTKVHPVERAAGGALNGGWGHDYNIVKEKSPEAMHMNADTWAVFGFYVYYGKFPDILPSTKSIARKPSAERLSPEHLQYLQSQASIAKTTPSRSKPRRN